MKRKIVLTAEQFIGLEKKLTENSRVADQNVRRAYSFDWDDNIVFMPTNIIMDYDTGDGWLPTSIGTEAFSELRNDPRFKIRGDSFDDFRNDDSFMDDLKEALENESFAPSFPKFKKALIYANPFSIITARGHSPSIFPEGIKMVIGYTFSDDELTDMVNNIHEKFPDTTGLDEENTIDYYLSQNEYHPVSSDEFMVRFNLTSTAASPEESKKIALKDYVGKVVDGVSNLLPGRYTRLSVGFSDDDLGNIEEVKKFIEDELKHEYPDVSFIVFDTSGGETKKIVIKKG